MTIRIGNQHQPNALNQTIREQLRNVELLVVSCGRGSPLGNPYRMTHEATRDEVCDKYQAWFDDQLSRTDNEAFHSYLGSIEMAANIGDVHLMCWCAPQRCHCETIKGHLDAKLSA